MKKALKYIGIFLLILFGLLNVMAAFHAYKFSHFYPPKEVIIKKPEQMTGIEKTGAIMFGIDYPRSPVTDSYPLPHQTFHITTADGINLEGWYAPHDSAKGTIILFHGHAGNRAGVAKESFVFHDMGYNVCLVDFRAHGNSSGNICTIGYYEASDVKATYDFVAAKGDKNIILWGVSLGAATIMKAMADYPEIKPSKIILQMPFASLEDAVKGRLRIMGLPAQPLSTMLTFWGGVEQGFWGFNHDPYIYAKQVHTPVLFQWGRNDQRVTEAETDSIYANLATTDKKLVIYEQSGHESLLYKEPEKWTKTVREFLEKK